MLVGVGERIPEAGVMDSFVTLCELSREINSRQLIAAYSVRISSLQNGTSETHRDQVFLRVR